MEVLRIATLVFAALLALCARPMWRLYSAWRDPERRKVYQVEGWWPWSRIVAEKGMDSILDEVMYGQTPPRVFSLGPTPGGHATYMFTHPNDIQQLLDESRFPKLGEVYAALHPILGRGLVTSEGELWKRQRRLITPMFHFAHLKPMRSDMIRSVARLANEVTGGEHDSYDCSDEYSKMALRVIVNAAFGGVLDAEELAVYWADISRTIPWVFFFGVWLGPRLVSYLPIPPLQLCLRRTRQARDMVRSLIKQRRIALSVSAQDDDKPNLVDALITGCKDGKPEEEEELIIDECITFLFAAHDTTSNLLAWASYYLAVHEGVQRKVREEVGEHLPHIPRTCLSDPDELVNVLQDVNWDKLTYTKQVLREALRMSPPVPFVDREAAEDCEIGGMNIKKGAFVYPFFLAAHHHPEYWNEPGEFRPERFDSENVKNSPRHAYKYVPFSASTRNCVGQRFAMMEATTALAIMSKLCLIHNASERSVHRYWESTMKPLNFRIRWEYAPVGA